MSTRELLLGLAIIMTMVIVAGTIYSSSSNATPTATTLATPSSSTTVNVAAGGGNATAPWTVFLPQEVRINVGDRIMWYNPTEVAEPHTVTFVLDNNTMASVESPLAVSNTTEFEAIPPGSNNDPILIPGEDGMNTLIALNARAFNPVTIDSQGTVQYMDSNANYTMTGNEKYVNSGVLLPEGQEQELPGAGNTFTVTFDDPGTYNYICIIHPWHTGSVIVEE